ncbi:MAG: ParB/RepB/Spo0J family partition protein [Acidobacteria bacterium]|nr:ParB/RepB/Spo0J family partition protein [Acidobacteriota bacterium]
MEKRPALGKGLSALIPDVPAPGANRAPVELDVDMLEPSEFQPRLHMDDAALEELAKSIRASGVIQPIVVRRVAPDRYQIIAGERRWRASQRAGLAKVPVVVKDTSATSRAQLLEWALVENLQREDLNPIEEATAYQRLAQEFNLTHDEIATRVGKDRSSVANTIRLLKLSPEVRADVSSNALSMGHARALVSLPGDADQRRIAREVIARGLSVRETEALVKKALGAGTDKVTPEPKKKDADTRAAEEALHQALGSPVEIVRRGKGGSVVIAFSSETELQRLYDYLTNEQR